MSALDDASAARHECRILVVDDSAFQLQLLTAILNDAGYHRIETAENGEIALERLTQFQYDLVLLDIMMPGIDGLEVCRRLRGIPAYRSVPVLVQTGLRRSGDRAAAFAAGATDFVSKPVDRQELVARLRVHADNRLILRGLEAYRESLEHDLALARPMYQALAPDPPQWAGFSAATGLDLAASFHVTADMGGDLWGLACQSDDSLGLFVLGIEGTGLAAAMTAFRLHAMAGEAAAIHSDPAAIVTEVDRAARQAGFEAPGTLLYLRVVGPEISYAACGAAGPLMVAADGTVGWLAGGGVPLAYGREARVIHDRTTLAPGASLLLVPMPLLLRAGGREPARRLLAQAVTRREPGARGLAAAAAAALSAEGPRGTCVIALERGPA